MFEISKVFLIDFNDIQLKKLGIYIAISWQKKKITAKNYPLNYQKRTIESKF